MAKIVTIRVDPKDGDTLVETFDGEPGAMAVIIQTDETTPTPPDPKVRIRPKSTSVNLRSMVNGTPVTVAKPVTGAVMEATEVPGGDFYKVEILIHKSVVDVIP